MRKFGLIGFPLTHSFSKKYFEEKFQHEEISGCSYDLFPLKNIEEFPSLVKLNPDLVGLNVTIPYKEVVIPFLNELHEAAKEIGAVNCIKQANGKLQGWNTDVFGFETSLTEFVTQIPEQVFVLGTGGSSKAVQYVLRKLNLPFFKVSRESKSDCITYSAISANLKSSNLFINTTPLGMFPIINGTPQIPFEKLGERDFLFDLIYNPAETLFLRNGKEKGCKTKNGLEMLQLQAEKSWEIWNL